MKVLIIDDEPLVRLTLERVARSRGHTVSLAEEGLSGLEKWINEGPDLVFLDVLMPGLNGPQVLKELGDKKTGKVVLISAYTGKYDVEKARSIGADLFISKPFDDIFQVMDRAEELVNDLGQEKKSNVVVKKVAPYPIEAVLIGDKGPQSVSIPHLAVRGCLIKLPEATLRVGQIFEIRFRIPVFNLEIVEAVKVVKVYIRYSGGAKSGNFDPLTANMSEEPAETEAETDRQGRSSSTAQAPQPGPEDEDQSEDENDTVEAPVGGDHMAELHFVSLLPENKRKIQAFLVRIGQL